MRRTITIERTSKSIKAWMLIAELGMLWSAIAFVADLVHNDPRGAAHWLIGGLAFLGLRWLVGIARWWENG